MRDTVLVAECCGAPCEYENTVGEECWGKVTMVGEDGIADDSWYLHSCEGHAPLFGWGKYRVYLKKP